MGKKGTHKLKDSVIADGTPVEIVSDTLYGLGWSSGSWSQSKYQVSLVPGLASACLPLLEAEIAKLVSAAAAAEC